MENTGEKVGSQVCDAIPGQISMKCDKNHDQNTVTDTLYT